MNKIGKLKILNSNEIEDSVISIGFECLDRELFKPEMCYDKLAKTGIKHARVQTGWSRCEKEKGIYDFTWLDNVVDELLLRGIKPWFNVGFGNPIYMDNVPNPTAVGCVPILYDDETYNAWKNFIKVLAEHYNDRITHYEIWNEPTLEHFWFPGKPNPEKYALFVQDSGKIIREVLPCAKIGACVHSPDSFDFITKVVNNLESNDIDFFCFHIYTNVPEFRYSKCLAQIKRILHENGMAQVEIWQGEGGFPSWAPKGHWYFPPDIEGGSERAQAVWQLRRYFIDVSCGIKMSSFFQTADMWEKPYAKAREVIKKPAAHGILNGLTYTPKKSYETISYLSALLTSDVKKDDFYMSVFYTPENICEFISTQSMTFKKKDSPLCAYYVPTDVARENTNNYHVNVDIYAQFNNPVLIDMYTGDVFEISGTVNGGITSFKNLPITDYPIVITEKSVVNVV